MTPPCTRQRLIWNATALAGHVLVEACTLAYRIVRESLRAPIDSDALRPQSAEAPEGASVPAPESIPDPHDIDPLINIPLDKPAPGGDDVARHTFPLIPTQLQPISAGQCLPPEPGSMHWYTTHVWQRIEQTFMCKRCFRAWP